VLIYNKQINIFYIDILNSIFIFLIKLKINRTIF